MRAAPASSEFLAALNDIRLDDVVSKHHADGLAVRKMLGQTERVRDSAFSFLVRIREVLQAKILAITQQSQKISGAMSAGNQQNVADSCVHESLDRIENHRPVIHRQQMFVGNACKREKP